MRNSEKKLYESEADIRPNRYVALSLTVLSFFYIGMMLLNEFDVFLVDKGRMRLCVFLVLFILDIPIFVSGMDSGLKDSRTKYLMIICTGIVVAITCIVLSFHSTLILTLPLLLAAQYPSSKLSHISMLCCVLCALITPVLSYLFGMWDTAFIERLCQLAGRAVFNVAENRQIGKGTAVLQMILYLSIPHMLIITAFCPLSASVARNNEKRLKNQIKVLHMSESDPLTGVLNRLSFENALKAPVRSNDGNVAVIYVDSNDLHNINNKFGHAAGDRMLICLADNLVDAFGNENVYRTGGDEFVIIAYGFPLEKVREQIMQVREHLKQNGYSVSVGVEYAQLPCSLPTLISCAEAKMSLDKKRYHINR